MQLDRKRIQSSCLAACLSVFVFLTVNVSAQQRDGAPSADQMLAAANEFISFKDVQTSFNMEIRRGGTLQKSYAMQIKIMDRDRMRIEFQQPAREKGRVLLRVKDKMWMFLPDLGKSMVISSRQSFLGSSFSNGDLLRTDLVVDYTSRLLGVNDIAGQSAYQLELRAKSSDVTYDRIVLWVAQENFRPLRAEYFTRSGKRLKSLVYDEPETVNGFQINRRMTVSSDLKKDEVTVLTLIDLVPNQHFAESLFVKENLDR